MLPLSRADLPPVQAKTRSRPEDTQVHEALHQQPDGGDHFWLKVQCIGLGHRQAIAAIARAAGVDLSLVASAGSRDRNAIVQQWITVPKAAVENPNQLKGAGYKRQLRVLEMREGAGAITPEHVSGLNCQLKLLGGGKGEGYQFAQDILKRLRQEGVPNYFGAISMGASGSHARWGKVLAQGKRLPRRVPASARDRGMYERAWQSRLFNIWVASRMEHHGLATVLEGDWLQQRCSEAVHSRPVVRVEDPEQAAKRVESWESVVMGPLWGGSYEASSGAALAHEQQVLKAAGPTPSKRCRGGLRAIRFQPKSSTIEKRGDDLVLNCQLPVDSFVAVMAEEFIRCEGHLQ